MVKNKIKHSIIVIILFIAYGCYDDKGNYIYDTLNDISVDTVGVQTHFVVSQFDSLIISPELKFSIETIEDSKLNFSWVIYSDRFENSSSRIDTLATTKNLRISISKKPQNDNYALVLYVKNKETGATYHAKYTVNVLASVVSGWMVMHTTDGLSDLDYIATPNSVPTLTSLRRMKNVYSTMNGKKIIGNPRFVSAVRVNNSVINYVYVGTDNQFLQLSGTDFSLLHSDYELFKTKPETILPQFVGHGPVMHYLTVLINNNQIHNINNQASQYWDVTFSKPLIPGSTLSGKVAFAPFLYFANQASSYVNQACVMYDTIGQRFVKLPFTYLEQAPILPFPEQISTARFDVNNIGKSILFFDKGYNGDGFAIFRNGTKKELYRMRFNTLAYINYDVTQPNSEMNNLAVAMYDLSSLPEIDEAKYYACGARGSYFYYATDRNIYAFSYAGSKQAVLINNPFPADEVITQIKLYNPGTDFIPLREVTGTVMYVATWNGTEGKVYEFAINTSSGAFNNKTEVNGVLDKKAPLNIFDGFGLITGMCAKVEGTGTVTY